MPIKLPPKKTEQDSKEESVSSDTREAIKQLEEKVEQGLEKLDSRITELEREKSLSDSSVSNTELNPMPTATTQTDENNEDFDLQKSIVQVDKEQEKLKDAMVHHSDQEETDELERELLELERETREELPLLNIRDEPEYDARAEFPGVDGAYDGPYHDKNKKHYFDEQGRMLHYSSIDGWFFRKFLHTIFDGNGNLHPELEEIFKNTKYVTASEVHELCGIDTEDIAHLLYRFGVPEEEDLE